MVWALHSAGMLRRPSVKSNLLCFGFLVILMSCDSVMIRVRDVYRLLIVLSESLLPCSPGRAARSVWKAYCTALASHALATQAATAAVGFSLGDASAQVRPSLHNLRLLSQAIPTYQLAA